MRPIQRNEHRRVLPFIPSLINSLVPAVFMYFAIHSGHPPGKEERIRVRRGGKHIMVLFAATILTKVVSIISSICRPSLA
jgi:hypothetical protein